VSVRLTPVTYLSAKTRRRCTEGVKDGTASNSMSSERRVARTTKGTRQRALEVAAATWYRIGLFVASAWPPSPARHAYEHTPRLSTASIISVMVCAGVVVAWLVKKSRR